MKKQSCKCKNILEDKDLQACNNPPQMLLRKKGFFYHIRARINNDEPCLLDLWIDEKVVTVKDSDLLGMELVEAIQQVMNKHTTPGPVGTC